MRLGLQETCLGGQWH